MTRSRWLAWPLIFGSVFAVAVLTFERLAVPRTAWSGDTLATEPMAVLVGTTDRLHASFIRTGKLYGVEDHFVYVSEDSGATFRRIGVIPKVEPTPLEALKNFVARRGVTRLIRRNAGAVNLIVLSSGTVLVFYDRIYRMEPGTGRFHPVESPAMSTFPFGGIAIGAGDTVYMGEYVTGQRPKAPRILRGTDDGRRWELAYTFPPGTVFHVHSVTYDPYRGGYWVAAGDTDAEAGLWFTSDNFRSLARRGGHGQDWRVVALLVRERELIWGSDNDQRPAGIFRWDLERGILTEVQEIHNPSYYAAELADGTLVITTTYEPESVVSRSVRRHPHTSIWVSGDGSEWREILRLDEAQAVDASGPVRPQIRLPGGDASLPQVFATPLGTTRHALETLSLRIEVRTGVDSRPQGRS